MNSKSQTTPVLSARLSTGRSVPALIIPGGRAGAARPWRGVAGDPVLLPGSAPAPGDLCQVISLLCVLASSSAERSRPAGSPRGMLGRSPLPAGLRADKRTEKRTQKRMEKRMSPNPCPAVRWESHPTTSLLLRLSFSWMERNRRTAPKYRQGKEISIPPKRRRGSSKALQDVSFFPPPPKHSAAQANLTVFKPPLMCRRNIPQHQHPHVPDPARCSAHPQPEGGCPFRLLQPQTTPFSPQRDFKQQLAQPPEIKVDVTIPVLGEVTVTKTSIVPLLQLGYRQIWNTQERGANALIIVMLQE